MKIEKIIREYTANFASIYDVVLEFSDIEKSSVSDAARALLIMLRGHAPTTVTISKSGRIDVINSADKLWESHTLGHLLEQIVSDNSLVSWDQDFNTFEEEYKDIAASGLSPATYMYKTYGWFVDDIEEYFTDLEIRLWSTSSIEIREKYFFGVKPCILTEPVSVPVYQEMTEIAKDKSMDMMFLDEKHPFFSPKLAACIGAWQYAVEQSGKNQKTPTDHAKKWLTDNQEKLGFSLSDKIKDSISAVVNYRSIPGTITEEEKKVMAKQLAEYHNTKRLDQAKPCTFDDFDEPEEWPF